jgi:hypothetical protein
MSRSRYLRCRRCSDPDPDSELRHIYLRRSISLLLSWPSDHLNALQLLHRLWVRSWPARTIVRTSARKPPPRASKYRYGKGSDPVRLAYGGFSRAPVADLNRELNRPVTAGYQNCDAFKLINTQAHIYLDEQPSELGLQICLIRERLVAAIPQDHRR